MRVVKAEINYLAEMSVRPMFCGPDVPETNLIYDPRTVEIRDARTLPESPSLDREGFALIPHATSFFDIHQDRDRIDNVYGAELVELIRALSGASEVRVVPGSTGRFVNRQDHAKSVKTMPAARNIHWDYTDRTAHTIFLPQIARLMNTGVSSLQRRYSRIAIYQTWRALSGPAQDVPLTVVDGRTVRHSDLVTCGLGDPTRPPEPAGQQPSRQRPELQAPRQQVAASGTEYGDGRLDEFSLSRYNPEHRWYYFPNMRRDELLVFKGYDFGQNTQSAVLHTAFDDPTAPADTPPRSSVEVRLFAFFE